MLGRRAPAAARPAAPRGSTTRAVGAALAAAWSRCRPYPGPARAARAGRAVRPGTPARFGGRRDGKGQAMASIPAPPVPLSQVGRAAHDLGLAGLLGGNLFGRLALHPERDRDPRQAASAARWSTPPGGATALVNSLSLAAVAAGWAGARAGEARPQPPLATPSGGSRWPRTCSSASWPSAASPRPPRASASRARRPTAPCRSPTATTPRRRRPRRQRRAKRRLNVLGLVSLAAEAGLVGVNAALGQQGFRRPPARRALPWRRP